MSQVIGEKSERSLKELEEPSVPQVQEEKVEELEKKPPCVLNNDDVQVPSHPGSNLSALPAVESLPASEPEQASKASAVLHNVQKERKRPKIVPTVQIQVTKKLIRLFRCRICSAAADSIHSLMTHFDKVHNIQVKEPPRVVPAESRDEKKDQENISKLLVSLESKPKRPRSRSSSTSSNNSNSSRSNSVKRNDSGQDKRSGAARTSKSCTQQCGRRHRKRKAFDPDENKAAKWSRCTICFMDFSEPYRFEDHIRMHAEGLLLQCQFCAMSFHFQYNLNNHLGIPHCQVPDSKQQDKKISPTTSTKEMGENECEASSTGMNKKNNLKYKCGQDGCGASFANQNCLIFHSIRHDGLHRCPTCEKSFERQPHLRKHIQRSHTHKELSTLKKPLSRSTRKRTVNLDKVTSSMTFSARRGRKSGSNVSSIRHKCPFCNQEFKGGKAHLRIHINRMHNKSSARRFTCPSCPLAFTAKGYLLRHAKAIHGVKEEDIRQGSTVSAALNVVCRPYSCPQCTSTYTAKYHLEKHVKIAHNKNESSSSTNTTKPVLDRRPFKCDQCPKAFTVKQNLTTHMHLFHQNKDEEGTGGTAVKSEKVAGLEKLRLFRCSKCPQAFTTRLQLTSHFNNEHRTSTAVNFICGLPVITRKRRTKVKVEAAAFTQDTQEETKNSAAVGPKEFESCDNIQGNKSELKTGDFGDETAANTRPAYFDELIKNPDDNGTNKAPYFCPGCPDKTFASMWNTNRHIRMIHQGKKEPITARKKRKRQGRKVVVEVKKRPINNLPSSGVKAEQLAEVKCAQCTMTFISQNYLDRHLKCVHNGGQDEGESRRGMNRKVYKEEESGSEENEASYLVN